MDSNNKKMTSKKKRDTIFKLFLSESESLFIKNHLEIYNRDIKNNSIENDFKEKSLSEFIRDILLEHLSEFNKKDNNTSNNNLLKRMEQLEKFTKRHMSLTFKDFQNRYGKEETQNMLNAIKDEEKKSKV